MGSAFNHDARNERSPPSQATQVAAAARPRRLQFTLKSLLLVITIIALIVAVEGNKARRDFRRNLAHRLEYAIRDGDVNEVDSVLKFDPQLAHGSAQFHTTPSSTTLQLAVRTGNAAVIDRILAENPDVNEVSDTGTAISWAVIANAPAEIAKLIARGADVNAADPRQEVTPLHLAVAEDRSSKNQCAVLKTLLASGANPNIAARDGQTPLHLAARRKNLAAVEALLNARANVNVADTQGETPLHIALGMADDLKVAEVLINQGASLTARDKAGWIPGENRQGKNGEIAALLWWKRILHLYDQGNVATIDQMFDAAPQALSFRTGYDPETFLKQAIRAKRVDVFDYLLARHVKAGLPPSVLNEALHFACYDRPDFVKRLLDAGAEVNAKDELGQSPLHRATRALKPDSLQLLLARGADLAAVDDAGATVLDATFDRQFDVPQRKMLAMLRDAGHPPTLLWCAATGDLEQLRQLAGDDLTALDRAYNGAGIRPLHAAVLGGQPAVVQWLSERGVDRNATHQAKDASPVEAPLMTALSRGNTEMAILLINLGADVNVKSWSGYYPLTAVLAWNRSPKILEALLAHNADRTVTYQKKTVLELAKESKSKDRARYLELLGVSTEVP